MHQGKVLRQQSLSHPATGHVFITGFNNHSGKFRNKGNWPIQVMFIHACDVKGEKVWTAYDFRGQAVLDQVLEADTRGYRLAMGPDGKLYLAGESAGGTAAAIALHPRAVAIAGDAKGQLKPVRAIREEPSGESDGWLVVIPPVKP